MTAPGLDKEEQPPFTKANGGPSTRDGSIWAPLIAHHLEGVLLHPAHRSKNKMYVR